jgi:quercetin dioxygenase-like cupin family protein
MALASKIVLAVAALGTSCILYDMAKADDVPDALSVEWQGKKPCEKLFDDEHVRVVRCTFAPGAVHVCHSHPSYLSYVVNGGQGQVQDEKGMRKIDVVAGALLDVPPTPWQVFANVGNTTIQFVVVEKKYQVARPVSQTACPKSEWWQLPISGLGLPLPRP